MTLYLWPRKYHYRVSPKILWLEIKYIWQYRKILNVPHDMIMEEQQEIARYAHFSSLKRMGWLLLSTRYITSRTAINLSCSDKGRWLFIFWDLNRLSDRVTHSVRTLNIDRFFGKMDHPSLFPYEYSKVCSNLLREI